MDYSLGGRKAIVTGAADGIGEAVTRRLASAGVHVVAVDVQGQRLEKAFAGTAGVHLQVLDVSTPTSGEEVISFAVERLGGLDILINNAGIAGPYTDVANTMDADWRKVMSINLDAVFMFCRAAIPFLSKSRCARIINTSSVLDFRAMPKLAAYSASKAAVSGFTRALAAEIAPKGITANAVLPGNILTGLTRATPKENLDWLLSRTPLGRFGLPDDIAEVYMFLASEGSRWMTGQSLAVDGGMTALL
jgi:NAD(P)-dependent dehydrogenase (short-subunit alcohol dehydrogenase family)